ncbi:MAG: Fe-S cluster assembly protein SufD [Bacteroidota bacterium]
MTTTVEIASEVREWVSNYEMLRSVSQGVPPAVAEMRDAAMQSFAAMGFPTTRQEEWKYTSLRSLAAGGFPPAFHAVPTGMESHPGTLHGRVLPAGLGGDIIVLVDGHFNPQLSRIQEGRIHAMGLKKAIESRNAAALAHLGKVAAQEGHALVALNTAMATDGAFIHIPAKYTSKDPVILVHLGCGDQVAVNGRTLVVAEAHSESRVLEIFYNWGGGAVWNNHVTEASVGEGASLELCSMQNAVGDAYSLTHFAQVLQGKDSHFRSLVMTSGGRLMRNDLQVRHLGTGCTTHLNGMTLLRGDSHVDHHTLVDHAQPHCQSNETYKSVLDGNSTCVFNGKVIVRPGAQKTNAFQSNKTLLLSAGATVNAKPQLEIFADDVKCSHGATTGRLDETALFYLRSRGISAPSARALLTYAFGAEVLEQTTVPELRDHLEAFLLQRLTGE